MLQFGEGAQFGHEASKGGEDIAASSVAQRDERHDDAGVELAPLQRGVVSAVKILVHDVEVGHESSQLGCGPKDRLESSREARRRGDAPLGVRDEDRHDRSRRRIHRPADRAHEPRSEVARGRPYAAPRTTVNLLASISISVGSSAPAKSKRTR
jgi:hypothetical protein